MEGKVQRQVLIALGILTLARILVGAFHELSPDEAYYFLWAERLDWSYYSKGPGVATVLKLSTALFGESSFGIRVMSALLGFGTSWLLLRLGRDMVGPELATWAVVLLNVTPIFNAGSIILTIDPLMLFFWAAALLNLWRTTQDPERLQGWLFAGLAIGLGFLCKYTILVLIVSLLLDAGLRKQLGATLRNRGFWLMNAVIALCTLPVLIWNARNGWITFVHLAERTGLIEIEGQAAGKAPFQWNPTDGPVYFLMHLGIYSPLVFLGLTWATFKVCTRFRASREEGFLAAYSLPLILFYFGLSFIKIGELNWTAPGFIGIGFLLLKYWSDWELPARLKRGLVVAAYALAFFLTLFAVNPDVARVAGLSWAYERDPMLRLRGWRSMAESLEADIRAFARSTGEEPFLITNRYQLAAAPTFYLADDLPVYRPNPGAPVVHMRELPGGGIKNQFAFWPRYFDAAEDGFGGRNALYFTDDIEREKPPAELASAFDSIEVYRWTDLVRRGRPVRGWKVFACYRYNHPSPEEP